MAGCSGSSLLGPPVKVDLRAQDQVDMISISVRNKEEEIPRIRRRRGSRPLSYRLDICSHPLDLPL